MHQPDDTVVKIIVVHNGKRDVCETTISGVAMRHFKFAPCIMDDLQRKLRTMVLAAMPMRDGEIAPEAAQ